MKIAFCIGSLNKGGAERVVSNLANYLIKNNDVSIITTINSDIFYKIDSKVKLFKLDHNYKGKVNKFKKNRQRIFELKRIIKHQKFDVIISFLPEPSYRVLFLKLFNKKIKVIVSVRNDPRVEYKSIINNLIMRFLYPKADGFVFQTEDAKNYFSKKIQQKSVIIPNPINENFMCKPFDGEREKIIVTVGRLEKQKNHKMLINAFSQVSNKIPEYKLIIYGSGSLKEELEQLIKKLKLNNKVILAGQIDDVKDKIYKASLFVLSSNYEGMPNALIEAMALGLPCISTDCPCGGPRYLINNMENGVLVELNNENELAKNILNLIANPSLAKKIEEKASTSIKKLNPERINNKWIEYVKSIVGKIN